MSALKQIVVKCLANNPETSAYFVATRTGAPLDEVERELQHLACDGRVVETPKLGWARPATYRLAAAGAIGECELCGVVDHHLVEGLCEACRRKCPATISPRPGVIARAREIVSEVVAGTKLAVRNLSGPDDDVALGAEADVSHALAVQRLREIESDPETRRRLDNFRLDTDRR